MVFCNTKQRSNQASISQRHNPYFNRWFSAIRGKGLGSIRKKIVTILILIDGFLQYIVYDKKHRVKNSHNPYFNRWFSAIHDRKI